MINDNPSAVNEYTTVGLLIQYLKKLTFSPALYAFNKAIDSPKATKLNNNATFEASLSPAK
ncbi:hypothetical protein FEM21_01410 [Flavobacterium seoulense]|uniref:Uncharacterized protein n=1 Tax=Flavobacterium seoulense TaxID=1492738 RepID=A0A066WVL2_9FLAO|nr:hypothetical protein FEM21_01410 [Flavobacterium seoulense]